MTGIQAALPLLIWLFCVCSAAQPAPKQLGSDEVKDLVKNIDSHLTALNKSRLTLQTGTDRGGELTVYRRGSNVVRVDATIGGSNSDSQAVFYYSGTDLVFVRTKTVTYPYSSALNGFDFTSPHVKGAADYYVRDGKLIAVDRAKISPPRTSKLLQEAELFMAAIRRGDRVVDIEKLLK
jgi:hypothetical protein